MEVSIKDKSYLWDISEASKDILQFIEGVTFHKFSNTKMIRYAVERQILVIGEAANHLSHDFKKFENKVPWTKIIGMRNIIAHEYGEILEERIWIIAKVHIQELLDNVNKYIV